MQSLSALLKCSQNIVFIEIRPKQVLSPVFNGVDLIQEKKVLPAKISPLCVLVVQMTFASCNVLSL